MTATSDGPRHAVTSRDGSRVYIHPVTGERWPSVSSILSHWPRRHLVPWAARLAAEAAVERGEWVLRASLTDPCNASRSDDACGECRECAVLWLIGRHEKVKEAGSSLGTRLHEAAEYEELHGPGRVDPDVLPFLLQLRRWQAAYRPTYLMTEATVISRAWGYAGTLDAIVTLPEDAPVPPQYAHLLTKPLVIDYKTSRNIDKPEGVQLAAYAGADTVLLADGSEQPMPEVAGALLIHLRPERVVWRVVELNRQVHGWFASLAAASEGFDASLNAVLSHPIHLPKEAA